ncbi:hypothetical protein D5086_012394 [Populus alba]|uniref:Uncharacterized protein n=1 Tax=Populus alba TaxID=43335 RepID=A0ACC4C3V1_POPAL
MTTSSWDDIRGVKSECKKATQSSRIRNRRGSNFEATQRIRNSLVLELHCETESPSGMERRRSNEEVARRASENIGFGGEHLLSLHRGGGASPTAIGGFEYGKGGGAVQTTANMLPFHHE